MDGGHAHSYILGTALPDDEWLGEKLKPEYEPYFGPPETQYNPYLLAFSALTYSGRPIQIPRSNCGRELNISEYYVHALLSDAIEPGCVLGNLRVLDLECCFELPEEQGEAFSKALQSATMLEDLSLMSGKTDDSKVPLDHMLGSSAWRYLRILSLERCRAFERPVIVARRDSQADLYGRHRFDRRTVGDCP